MKTAIVFAIVLFIVAGGGISLSSYLKLARHRIQVIDVVTQKPIAGVELGFSFADSCYPEDVYYSEL